MNTSIFTERQVEILRLLRDTRDGEERMLLDRVLEGNLPKASIQVVCEMINDEFLMKGIKPDYTPNAYGYELETLLDVVNRPRVSPAD
jgi:hypothetical protein